MRTLRDDRHRLFKVLVDFSNSGKSYIELRYEDYGYINAKNCRRSIVRMCRNNNFPFYVTTRKGKIYIEKLENFQGRGRESMKPDSKTEKDAKWITHPRAFMNLEAVSEIFDYSKGDLAAIGDVALTSMHAYFKSQKIPRDVYNKIMKSTQDKIKKLSLEERDLFKKQVEAYVERLKTKAGYALRLKKEA